MDTHRDVLRRIAECCEEIEDLSASVGSDSNPEQIDDMLSRRSHLLRVLGFDLGHISGSVSSDRESQRLRERARAGLLAALAQDTHLADALGTALATTREELDKLGNAARAATSYALQSSLMRDRR